MEFEPGQVVVHPHHGTATVKAVEEREFRGTKQVFVVMQRDEDDLELRVPLASWEAIGVRQAIGEKRAHQVLRTLASEPEDLSRSWQKRRTENDKRLRSGNAVDVAKVVRDLRAYDEQHDMPLTDRRTYEEARARTTAELCSALDESEDQVQRRIDNALGITPEPA